MPRAKKGSFEDVFGHLGDPQEVADEWSRMRDALVAIRDSTYRDAITLRGMAAQGLSKSVARGESAQPCNSAKMGEFNMLRCCRPIGHTGEHTYVVDHRKP